MRKYQHISTQVECPVCCTEDAHRLWNLSSKQAAQHFVLQEKQSERHAELVTHIDKLWGQNTSEIVQCDNCGFCHCNPYVAGDERFYFLAYDPSGYPTWKWEFQVTLDALRTMANPDCKMLEIGAGDGAFIRRIAGEILPKENILCTEFSVYGREHIGTFGVKCFPKDVRELSEPEFEKTFDVVCLFQVLEHMDGLSSLFQQLTWLIKDRGSLFIAVPNAGRIEFNELNGALLDMPPNHVGRWNKKCFDAIGKRYGFRVADYVVEKSDFFSSVKQFVIYRYLRRAQRSGSFENKIQTIKSRFLFKMIRVFGVGVNLLMAIPAFFKRNFGLGDSQWVHLIKEKK